MSVYVQDGVSVNGSYHIINGDHCNVNGMNHVINGDYCTVNGMNHVINGDHCTVRGVKHTINGDRCIGSGVNFTINGNDCKFAGVGHKYGGNITIGDKYTIHKHDIGNIYYDDNVHHISYGMDYSDHVGAKPKEKEKKKIKHMLNKGGEDYEEDDVAYACVMCMTNANRVALVPCGHKCLCIKCTFELDSHNCPICMKDVDNAYIVFD